MRVSVVLPIYRTAPYLRELHERLVKVLTTACAGFELVMVDDGSPDGAWDIVSALAANDPRVKGLRLSRNFGQHPAISAGFDHCQGDVIVLMDADLQDRPEDIPLLLDKLQGDVDVVYTAKAPAQVAWQSGLPSRLYHALLAQITGIPEPERIGTFRLFTRRFLEAVRLYPERSVLYGPLMFQIGFKHAVVEVAQEPRRGQSSYSFRKRLSLAVNSLITYTDLPHRVLVVFGFTTIAATALYAVILIARYFLTAGNLPSGLTLLALLITLSLGATMIGLGIIGIYVFRVYQEVLRRPRYVVARSLNLDR